MLRKLQAVRALASGVRALGDGEPREAVPHLLQGLGLSPRGSTAYLLRQTLVEAYEAIGDSTRTIEALEAIAKAAEQDANHPSPRHQVYRFSTDSVPATHARLDALARIAELHGEAGAIGKQLQALSRLAEAAGETDLRRRARVLREKAGVALRCGLGEEALRSIEQAVEDAVARSHVLEEAEARYVKAAILWDLGERADAREQLAQARAAFEKSADLAGVARADGLARTWHKADEEGAVLGTPS